MKFSFYTTLTIGILHLLFQFVVIADALARYEYFGSNTVDNAIQAVTLFIFGLAGLLLLICSNQIKRKMKRDELTKFDSFLKSEKGKI